VYVLVNLQNAGADAVRRTQTHKCRHPPWHRTIHHGTDTVVFTVGYEKRTGAELIDLLKAAAVDVLVDVRQRALSRKPDFRGKALRALCEEAGIEYRPMPDLGSTKRQRERLWETGDFTAFRKSFTAYAQRNMPEPVEDLAQLAQERTIAMLCYERCHEECHRSIIADFLVREIDATVVALV